MRQPVESEIAWVVRAKRAEKICAQIARYRQLGEYRLITRPTEHIHDIYFDTPNGDLSARRLSLRIRNKNGKHLITFKGQARVRGWGGRARTEIELAWSRQALQTILRELKRQKIALNADVIRYRRDAPLQTLAHLGWCVIQDRTTHRRVRHIVARQHVLAELAIDWVAYRFGKRVVRLREIEIELKATRAERRLAEAIAALMATHKKYFRRAPGKLAIGRAIEKMVRSKKRLQLTDDKNNLTPLAYDKIEKRIKKII